MSPRIGVITQARTSSSRLPGKVLLPLGDENVISCHARRASSAGPPVIVATTVNRADDPIVDAAESLGLATFRGDENDVLSRYAQAAATFDLDVVVRVTSDCPLVDGDLIATGLTAWLNLDDPSAFVSNTLDRTYPRGLDFEIFSTKMLHEADRYARHRAEREHVTPYFYGTRARARPHQIRRGHDASNHRLTLDTFADYRLLRRIVIEHGAASLDAEQLISLLDARPDLATINESVQQKTLDH